VIFPPSYAAYNKLFLDEISKNLKIEASFDKLDNTDFWEQYMVNTFQFSCAKELTKMRMLQQNVYDENKKLRTFSQFKNLPEVKELQEKFDGQDFWLRTEYELAARGSIMADKWKTDYANKDINPYWIYVCADEPCEICEPLDGMIFKYDNDSDDLYPPQHFNCFPAGTQILTHNGWINIERLRVNDKIIGGSGNIQNIDMVHVNMVNDKLISIILKNFIVSCTPNHRILTTKGWIIADNLQVGDIIVNIRKKGFFNKIITYINNVYVLGCNMIMSNIIKGSASLCISKTFNSEIQNRNKNINPIRKNKVIKFGFITKIINVVNHCLFANRWFCFCIGMLIGIFSIRFNVRNFCFNNNIFIKHGIKNSHPIRTLLQSFTRFLSFTKIKMWNFRFIFVKSFALLLFPVFIIYPLKLYVFTVCSNWYIKHSQKFWDNSIIRSIPTFHNFCKRHFILNIKSIKNINDGFPFDRFDTFNDFLYSIIFHNKLNLITGTKVMKYTDKVYNLSVSYEQSYVTKIGIVHNCLCTTEPTDEAGDNDEDLATQEEIEEGLERTPEQFRGNVGKDGIFPRKDSSYFSVLPSANDADYSMFENPEKEKEYEKRITSEGSKLNSRWYNSAELNIVLDELINSTLTAPKEPDTLLFRNHTWKLNVRVSQQALKKIAKGQRGVANIKSCIEKPDEIFGKWINPKEQKGVQLTYILNGDKESFFVITQGGFVNNFYFLRHSDSIKNRKFGVKFMK
jgi:hypothetical protein